MVGYFELLGAPIQFLVTSTFICFCAIVLTMVKFVFEVLVITGS